MTVLSSWSNAGSCLLFPQIQHLTTVQFLLCFVLHTLRFHHKLWNGVRKQVISAESRLSGAS